MFSKKISTKLILTDSFDDNFVSGNKSDFFRIYKDKEYLNWRYKDKPNSDYSIYKIVKEEKILGYIVLRFKGYKCYIHDILVNNLDRGEMITVLRSIENKALEEGIRIIVYNVLDNLYWQKLFNRHIYFKKNNNKSNYYLTIKIHNNSVPQELVTNKDNWIIMNGDIL